MDTEGTPRGGQDASPKRVLLPEEKRAPRVVPWRMDWRESVATVGVVLIAIAASAWLLGTFVLHSNEIGWREDGVIVEVHRLGELARPGVESALEGDESFPWAREPVAIGDGPCRDPRFRIDGMPERGKIYEATDTLAITLAYDAPGCADIQVTFRGQFQRGSPWHQRWCDLNPTLRDKDGDCPLKFVDGEISSLVRHLDDERGTVMVEAAPGTAPTAVPSSPWNVSGAPESIEGLKLCELIIRATDGVTDGSRSTQTVHVDCEEADNIHLSRSEIFDGAEELHGDYRSGNGIANGVSVLVDVPIGQLPEAHGTSTGRRGRPRRRRGRRRRSGGR